MSDVDPARSSALGRGFRDDAYAVDGNHLRWAFDPRLGFPRHAICVDVRLSLLDRGLPREIIHDADLRLPAGIPVLAENVIRAGQAACSYSRRMPPRRSRRWMLRWAS
jgi:hypothetical protein